MKGKTRKNLRIITGKKNNISSKVIKNLTNYQKKVKK